MTKDFRKSSLEYNAGFIDGLLWALDSGNKIGLKEIISMVGDIRKASDEKLSNLENQFEQLRINSKSE